MKNKKITKYWFTFVELIIVIVIIIILSWVWINSYVWYISWARDTQRKSDLLQVASSLQLYKQKRWYYWFPWDFFNLTYSWIVVANQGKLNTNVHIDSLEKLPLDPKTKSYYSYSITKNKQEFQLAWTLENNDINVAIVNWNYKTVSKNILPTILLAIWANSWDNIEIKDWYLDWTSNRDLFIFDNQEHNLPYTFEEPYDIYSDWISFTWILTENEENNYFWQNSDYRNCIEISEAWKLIIPLDSNPFEYQIISETWALVNTWCTL